MRSARTAAVVLGLMAVHASAQSSITNPPAGTVLPSSSVTFQWNDTPAATDYELFVGTNGYGSSDIAYADVFTNFYLVSGLPTNVRVYVTLTTWTGFGQSRSFLYNDDIDQDGIRDSIDPQPGVQNAKTVRTGTNYTMTILGSDRLVSLQVTTSFFDSVTTSATFGNMQTLSQLIYQQFRDQFDFIYFTMNQTNAPGGSSYVAAHFAAQNAVQGVGKSLFNNTASYGSTGHLLGVVHALQHGSLKGGPSLHEILHQWANSLNTNSFPTKDPSHWGASSVGGTLGGWKHSTFVDLGGGNYQVNPFNGITGAGNSTPYADLELYMMGMLPPQNVPTTYVAVGFANYSPSGTNATFTASYISNVPIATITAANGVRVPDSTNSQKNFRMMHVIVTKAPLSNALWAQLDDETYNFDIDGADDNAVLYNFYEATGGRGTLQMDTLSTGLTIAASSPIIVADTATLADENCPTTNTVIDPGETVTFSFGLKNNGSAGTSNAVATMTAFGGIIGVNSSQTFGVIGPGATVARSFTFMALGSCGGTVTARLQVVDGTNNLGNADFILAEGAGAATTQNFDSVTAPALPSGWATSASGAQSAWVTTATTPNSAPNAAFSTDASNVGVNELVSPTVQVQSASAKLYFTHKYQLDYESGPIYYDGGVLEIKIGGGSFTDILAAAGSFAANGYVGTLNSSFQNPLAGRSAWSGDSGGYLTTIVNLPAAAAGQPVQFRWRCGSDNGVSAPGWWIDDVLFVETSCCSTPQDIIRFTVTSLTNFSVRSVGASASVGAEYTTNLAAPQIWIPLTNDATVYTNGTNVTTFGVPSGIPNAAIRLVQ
jgi:hypothetical protein